MDRVSQIKKMLETSPADSFLQHALALEYVKSGDDAAARTLFEEVLQRDPGYIGSYYHLAGLLERNGEAQLAAQWYEKGMAAAKTAGEQKTYNELRAAYEALTE